MAPVCRRRPDSALWPGLVVAAVIMQETHELFPQPIGAIRRAYGCSGFKDLVLKTHRQLVPQQQRRRTEAVQHMPLRIGERHGFAALIVGQSPQRATLAFPSGESAKIYRSSGLGFIVAHTVDYEPERRHPPAQVRFAPDFVGCTHSRPSTGILKKAT